jgi:hypothetical protein
MQIKHMKKTADIITALLILLFSYTAISKFTGLHSFTMTLGKAPVIKQGAAVIAILLPTIEAFIVLLLFFERTKLKGLYASLLLLLVFTTYLIGIIFFAPGLPCSCGGVISRMSWRQHVVFNFGFIVLTAVAIRIYKRTESIQKIKPL